MTFRATLAIICTGLLSHGVCQSGPANHFFLVVVASSENPAVIAEKAGQLAPLAKNGFVIQTADCKESRNIFAFVTEATTSHEAALAALTRAMGAVPDAYIKTCNVKPGSNLALHVSAVDPSIADVPKDAVNWTDEDRVSTAQPLPDRGALVIVRYYAKTPDDPLEGRRERVVLAESVDRKIVLEDQCTSAGSIATDGDRIAFSCAIEQAGDFLIHAVMVFDSTGKKLKELRHCRNPKWFDSKKLACEAESVGANGKLMLKAIQVEID
jgi:hypothetical protein